MSRKERRKFQHAIAKVIGVGWSTDFVFAEIRGCVGAKVPEALESVITDGFPLLSRNVPTIPSEVASRRVRTGYAVTTLGTFQPPKRRGA